MTEAFHYYYFWKEPSLCAGATRFPVQITYQVVGSNLDHNVAGTFKTWQALIPEDSNIKTFMDIKVPTSKFSP
jgi:hypothetical protein